MVNIWLDIVPAVCLEDAILFLPMSSCFINDRCHNKTLVIVHRSCVEFLWPLNFVLSVSSIINNTITTVSCCALVMCSHMCTLSLAPVASYITAREKCMPADSVVSI